MEQELMAGNSAGCAPAVRLNGAGYIFCQIAGSLYSLGRKMIRIVNTHQNSHKLLSFRQFINIKDI
ncbi:hypothetical protein [Paenibacillus zanthoxyli]|uniref:hypothetical protein n=1 Tax=Paenibacillus zanthoxyli TaxID=369399 RepID=UPI0012EB329C|nr:hypothetical protein [Paenibacillus zanthoxyli]